MPPVREDVALDQPPRRAGRQSGMRRGTAARAVTAVIRATSARRTRDGQHERPARRTPTQTRDVPDVGQTSSEPVVRELAPKLDAVPEGCAQASGCSQPGSWLIGKNVPENRKIGRTRTA